MVCKKCGYQRGGNEDPQIPLTQCPSCLVFYSKIDSYEKKSTALSKRKQAAKDKRELKKQHRKALIKQLNAFLKYHKHTLTGLVLFLLASININFRLLFIAFLLYQLFRYKRNNKADQVSVIINDQASVITDDIENAPGLLLSIKYKSAEGERIERKLKVVGLGKFRNSHYVIAHCYLRNKRRTFKLNRFRNCVDLETGEVISKVKDYILAFNPNIIDLTDELEALQQRD